MANPKRRPDPEEPDFAKYSDFALLNAFIGFVSKDYAQQLKLIAWEIMRRYTNSLKTKESSKPNKDCALRLGSARWGDAKRVEAVYGLKRGVLQRLRDDGVIKSKSLGPDSNNAAGKSTARAKRLYDLISIAEYLEA